MMKSHKVPARPRGWRIAAAGAAAARAAALTELAFGALICAIAASLALRVL